MSLMRWKPISELDPWGRLTNLEKDMDRIFDMTFGRGRPRDSDEMGWWPAMDVYETGEEIIVDADIPGLDKEDLQITVLEDVLTLKGIRKRSEEVKQENVRLLERSHGAFQRVVALPAPVDAGKVKAAIKNGVLRVTMPKHEKVKPKQVDIQIQ